MKKTLSTLILAGIVVLITGTFCFAEYAAAGVENFPYFHLGCLIVGGMIIVSVKQKYEKIYLGEAAGSVQARADDEAEVHRSGFLDIAAGGLE